MTQSEAIVLLVFFVGLLAALTAALQEEDD